MWVCIYTFDFVSNLCTQFLLFKVITDGRTITSPWKKNSSKETSKSPKLWWYTHAHVECRQTSDHNFLLNQISWIALKCNHIRSENILKMIKRYVCMRYLWKSKRNLNSATYKLPLVKNIFSSTVKNTSSIIYNKKKDLSEWRYYNCSRRAWHPNQAFTVGRSEAHQGLSPYWDHQFNSLWGFAHTQSLHLQQLGYTAKPFSWKSC